VISLVIEDDALAAGATGRRRFKWFEAGWKARDRRAAHQIRLLAESYSEDLRIRTERVDQARAEREEARAERDALLNRKMVPEGYIILAQTECTLPGVEPKVEYVMVKEAEWNETISVIGECCDGQPHE